MILKEYDSLVIGGGFFGLYITEHLMKMGRKTLLVEKENDFMKRASFVNQARVHNGYHYPRSILTGARCQSSFPKFVKEFNDCVVSDFDNYYAIGNILSKITARQFRLFCQSIGAVCDPAPDRIKKLFNSKYIEDVYSTKEYVFDAQKLKQVMVERLQAIGAECKLLTKACSIKPLPSGRINVLLEKEGQTESVEAKNVFNCTYSQINQILHDSEIDLIPLKHEMTEMCLVELPDELKNIGITVMCGPFFSIMPFPHYNLHTLSHVRYTPHFEWYDSPDHKYLSANEIFKTARRKTNWQHMWYDSKRYIPILEKCRYKESLWEVKTILPRSESDDSRPILFVQNHEYQNFHCIMGAKIDNVYDVIGEIDP